MAVSTLFTALLTVLLCWYIMRPLIVSGEESAAARSTERGRMLARKEQLLQALKDLDLDNQTGKISTEDYIGSRSQMTSELAELYAALDSAG
ncbi:MAG: hypothetical protein DCC75_02565 [Proteobacteria bacterium]|nr:MAG: hypothetical protein DCC75_02565 [Pseudomonadota bacterium]